MADKGEVADVLEEIGLLLDLLGENPFKTRAYANAARTIRSLERDLADAVRSGELSAIKGIGAALADKIATLVTTGRLPYVDELRSRVPGGLLDWLRIPGLGPKKARKIHESLGIGTLDELEDAARAGRLRGLEGFGEATERKILEGIARVREHSGRFLSPVVRAEAERLLGRVRGVPGLARAEVAGSVRRCAETSKDVDIVAAAADPEAVIEAFATDAGVAAIVGRGPTKCSVRLAAGPNADLRVVPAASFPFALLYFTGSKAHNIALRSLAQKRGFKLNEYALSGDSDGEAILAATEEEVYAALGLPFIPPEMREDRGEIEAALDGPLPDLLKIEDIRGVLHCHSTWSDGRGSIREMAEAARERDLTYLGLCDHSRSAGYAGGLSIERVRAQHDEIEALNREYAGTFTVLKGIEVDILPDGSLDFPDEVLESFDLVVASVHSRFGLSADEQTRRMITALDNPFVDILGHPTGRLLLMREPYPLNLEAVLEAASERNVAVEINAHPSRLDLDAVGLRFGIPRGMKTCICPDAHGPEGIDDILYGVGMARRGWCTAEDVLNAWPLDRLREHLSARRAGIR